MPSLTKWFDDLTKGRYNDVQMMKKLIRVLVSVILTVVIVNGFPKQEWWQDIVSRVTPATRSTVVSAIRQVYLTYPAALLITWGLVYGSTTLKPKKIMTSFMTSLILVIGTVAINRQVLITNSPARDAQTGDHIITLSKSCAYCEANKPAVRELQYVWNLTKDNQLIFAQYDDDSQILTSLRDSMTGRGQSIAVGKDYILAETFTVSDPNHNPVYLSLKDTYATAVNNTTSTTEKAAIKQIWNVWERGERHLNERN